MNTPVQTYDGLATMLAEDFETIIPATLPSPGFEFHEANYKDIAPRLGATYRLSEKTVLRAGFGIYYNPNQMNSFTFLTNNPPLAAVTTYTSDPANPTLSFDRIRPASVGPAGRPDMISPTRELPNARKDQWSFDVQRELWRDTALDFQYVGSNTSHLDRSFFNNTPQPGAGDSRPRGGRARTTAAAGSSRTISIADYDAVSIILRKRMSHGIQADAHYTWSRTRDMSTHSNGGGQTMDNYDIWRDYGPANWDVPHRFVASYIYDMPVPEGLVQRVPQVRGRGLAGVGRHHHPERDAGERHDRRRPGQYRHHRRTAADLVGAVPSLDCQANSAGATQVEPAAADELLRRVGVRACRRSSRSGTRIATSFAGRSS